MSVVMAPSLHEMLPEQISRRRTIVMGVAALMIYFAHAYSYIELGVFEKIFSLGNWGVDIFLLLSGFGLLFSVRKNLSLDTFYIRRFIKVGIPYLVLSIPLCFLSDILLAGDRGCIGLFLLDVSTLSYWLFHRGAWYVAMLVPLYCAVPFIEKACRYFGHGVILPFSIALCYLAYGIFSAFLSSVSILSNVSSVLVRLPSFFVGYWLAACYPSIPGRINIVYITLFSFTAMVIWGVIRWMSCIPALVITLWLSILPKTPFDCFFEALGRASLESYLLNIYLLTIMRDAFGCSGPISYALISLAAIMGALIIHKLLEPLQRKLLK